MEPFVPPKSPPAWIDIDAEIRIPPPTDRSGFVIIDLPPPPPEEEQEPEDST